jgi:hypothetical protein
LRSSFFFFFFLLQCWEWSPSTSRITKHVLYHWAHPSLRLSFNAQI